MFVSLTNIKGLSVSSIDWKSPLTSKNTEARLSMLHVPVYTILFADVPLPSKNNSGILLQGGKISS